MVEWLKGNSEKIGEIQKSVQSVIQTLGEINYELEITNYEIIVNG